MMNAIFFLLVSAVLLAVKRNPKAGILCAAFSMLSSVVFDWFWYTGQAKGRAAWYELAFGNPRTILFLIAGLILIIAHAAAICRRNNTFDPNDYYDYD